MSRRLTNTLLLVATLVLVATGLIAWAIPESKATFLYDVHRVTGVGLVLALPWKELIARSSLTRRLRLGALRAALPGVLSTLALLVTVAIGAAWTLGLVSFDRPIPYSAMNLHVFAGIALVPLTAWHVLQRWEPPRPRDLAARRAALRLLALGAIALVVGVAAEHVPGGRRITGSKHAGSFTANDMPLTIWTFDQVPAIDPRAWRLELQGAVADHAPVDLDMLGAGPLREVDAVIDCTGGWWSEQRWRGRPLLDLLTARGIAATARSVTVTSVTGHSWSYPIDDLADAILATHIGGEPLSAGHGAPVRLVVPGRRGFQWIKWVSRVEVT